jgi:hypothetical protein
MEWYAYGLEKIMIFIFAVSCAGGIVLAVVCSNSLIKRGPKSILK